MKLTSIFLASAACVTTASAMINPLIAVPVGVLATSVLFSGNCNAGDNRVLLADSDPNPLRSRGQMVLATIMIIW